VLGSESFNPVTVGMGIPYSTEVINVPLHFGLRGSLRGGTFLASCHAKFFETLKIRLRLSESTSAICL
jgi:hypothetical protein